MSAVERIKDFGRWLRNVDANLGAAKPPKLALGVRDGAPVRMRRAGLEYEMDKPVSSGESAPIFLPNDSTLSAIIKVKPEATIYGLPAAKIEAAKASPFPLEDGAYALTASPAAWSADGAEWRLVAAPKQRIDDIRATISGAGARPGKAFAMVEGAPVFLESRRSAQPLIVTALVALLAALVAAISVSYGAASITGAAQARLADAREALAAAESEAAEAQRRREAAAGPLRQAQVVGAALDRAPSVVARLAALSSATPDIAYVKRLSIRPDLISGEFIAPDAAALAAAISADRNFASARLKGPARAEAETQQRATLDIIPGANE